MSVYRSLVKIALICLSSTALVACGDGSNAGVFGLASVFSSGSGTVDFSENSTEVIYTADASASSSQSLGLAYTLSGGDDLDKFELGAKSGNLWFIEPQDFENPGDANQDNAYEVEISAYEIAVGDDLNEDNIWSVTLTVRLSDANEAPTFDSPAVVSADENSAGVIYVAAASDVDAGDSYSFSLVSGDDRSWFSLDGSDLSFTSPPDYEIAADSNGDNAYELVIRVTDSSGLSADLNLTVYVTDVNDAPTITNAASNLIVPENTSGIIYEIVATDAENDTLEYEISSVDSAAFSISGSAVSFNSIPDYEFPTDSGFDNAYNINIEVSDGSNITTQALTVAVNDLNDNIPIIVPSQNFIIQENSSIGTVLGAVEVNDGDATATTYQDWKIKGGNTNGAFAIDPSSGELSVANSSALDYESGTTSYALTLTVSDGVNTSSSEIVNVNVYDVNEAPVIDSDQTFAVAENKPDGGTIGVVQAEDVDAGAALQDWQIVAGNTNGAFALNASTGVLSVAKSSELDYESGTTSYFLALTVSDGVNTSGLKTLTVNINDVNDNTPAIDSAQSFDVYENSADNTLVGNVVFSDADSDEVNTFTWSITDGNTDGAFAINANGEITVATSSQLDHETTTSYTLSLQVSDGDNISAEESLRIDIKDLNDNQPKIEAGVSFRIDEDSADNTYVGTVNATDADSASVNSFTWSITSENTSDIFAIETGSVAASSGYASSGEIRVINSSVFDYETQPSYELTITVSDGSNTSFVQTVQVNLDDVNEAPFFTSASTATTSENNQLFVYTATADDLDDGDSTSLSYDLIGGADQSLFDLNGAALSFIVPPDYETLPDSGDNTYEVELQVTDTGGLSDELNLSISVVDTNDNAPVITAKQTFTIDENSENGISLGTVALDDPDTDAVNTFTWTITSSNTNNAFSIDSDDGELRVATSSELDHESTPSYTIKLTVNDGQQNSAEADITIKVDDVNESPVINSDSVTEVSVAENINHETYIIYQATATDSDDTPLATDPEGDTLTYSLAGEDADLFTIGTSDGIVKFQAAPDYDAPTDADKNNEYKISIQVSDSIHTAEHAMLIYLTGIDEPPVINNTNTVVNVAENIGTGLIEYDINATDPEGASLTYGLSGVDASSFNISSAGYISFNISPNYEAPHDNSTGNDYQVTIGVSDGTTETVTQAITIKVNNVNEAPTADAGDDKEVNEGNEVALSASYEDPDEEDPNHKETIAYSWQEVDSNGNSVLMVDLSNADTATSSFTSPTDISADTAITFQLTVTDDAGNGNSATDSVVITVNHSPIADAGVNQNVDEGEQVTLTGSASDTDGGEIKSYSWVEVQADDQGNLFSVSPGTVTLTNPTATDENKEVTTSFTAPEVVADSDNKGVITLTFQLTVTDDDAAEGQSLVEVAVENQPVIDQVYLDDEDSAYGIGDTATVYIQADKSETGLNLQASSTFNGGTLTGFTEIGGSNAGLYSAKYSVLKSHYSVAAGGTVTKGTGIVLTDDYGHTSQSITEVALAEGQHIDTAPPEQTISAIEISHDTGTYDDDFIINAASQTITAKLSAALDTNAEDLLYGSVASDESGPIWVDITNTILNDTSISWSTTLSSGAESLIQFKVVDAAGNDGQVTTQAYTLDTEPPAQTISAIALSDDTGTSNTDLITNAAYQTISATLSAALATGDILYGSVRSDESGALDWEDITGSISEVDGTSIITWDEVELEEGTHDLIFRITDIADNNTTFDEKYTLDQTAPNIVISDIAFSDDTGTESDDFITNTATQTISAALDLALDTAGGDILYGSVASDDAGLIWTDITAKIDTSNSISIIWDDVPLATGTHDLIFRITDIADNNTTFDQEYTLDQTAPNIVISDIAFSDDTGTESDDFITNTATQTISAALDLALDTAGGDILYGSVASDDAGLIWTDITAKIDTSNSTSIIWDDVPLATGTHDLIFRITDIADNNTTFKQEYTLDQTAPNIVISDIAFSDDTGTESDDFITNTATQTISATLDLALDTAGGDILYGSVASDDAGLIWTDITAKIDTSNSTSIIWDDVPLATGTHDLRFRITDIADNNTTFDQEYTLDQTAPDIDFSAVSFSNDTGTKSDDFITNSAKQTISATLSAALDTAGGDILYGSVSSDNNSAPIWLDITDSISEIDGTTTITWGEVDLVLGTHKLIFRITDIADNNTTFDQEYTLDQTAPNIVISDIAFSDDTGTESDDFITNTATQTISATLDLALDTAGGDILYGSVASDDAGLIWTDITAKIDTSNSTSIIWDDVPLATGTHDLIFRITDIADNNTTFDQEYTLDQTAPNIVISDIAFSDDTGTESDDFITNTATQTISATLDLALDTAGGDILYGSVASDDAGLIWTDITAKIDTSNSTSIIWDDVPLATGTHDLIFRITDIADNNTTFDKKYTLDQTAPNIVISDIAFSDDTGTESDDFITNTATQTISATLDLALDTAGGDILYGSVASDDAGLIWTDITAKIGTSNSTSIIWDDVPLATGTHDLIFRITDIADNNTTFDQEYTLDQTAPNIVISDIAFSDDTGTESDDFITNTATQTISATLDLALDTAGGDILYGSVASDDAGLIWTDITAKIDASNSTSIIWDNVPLATGTHDLIFRITDIADNNTTFDQEYTLDQTAPDIDFSAVSFSNDTGTKSDDFITNSAKQTISATLSAALDTAGGDILYGSVSSDNNSAPIWLDITDSISEIDGTTTITWGEVDLVLGTHKLILRITDIADNNTTFEKEYTLDQTVPNIVISDIAFSDDTGTKPDDFITNSAKQTISANLSAALATGDILYGSVGSDESGALDWEDITGSISEVDGTSIITWDEVELEEGTHDLIFRITDIADNNTTFDQEYTLDQTAPNIVISDIAFSDDTGTESDDFITNTATQTISATLDLALDTAGGDILYGSVASDDAGLIWTDITAKIDTSNSTSIIWDDVPLATGTHGLIFRITDIADNNTTFDQEYTLDQTAPNIVISDIAFSDDTGTESDDFITNTATQTISATLDLALDTAGGDILYGSVASDDAGLIWTDITAKIDTSNSTSIIWDDVPLATGTHDLIFRITDIADNNTTFDQEYTLDQTAPNIVISDIAFSDDTGTESDDFITNTAAQTISATLDLALDTAGGDILYGSVASNDAGLIWTDITAKIDTSNSTSIIWDDVPLATGTHDLIFRITDIADNNTTFDQEYTLDQTAPNIVISAIAFSDDTGTESDDFITNTATQTISATLDLALDTAGGDILYGSVASDDAGLIWTDITAKIDTSNSISIVWDDVPLATGTHDLIFRITDIADNNTTFDQEYTLDQTAPDIDFSAVSFSNDTGTKSDDFITNSAKQTISATLSAALDTAGGDILYGSVSSDNNSAPIWLDITDSISEIDGTTTITWGEVDLVLGTHKLIFRITDIADNNTTFDQEYTLDQTAPNIVISDIAFSDDTGTESDDFITNTATQTISATLDLALDTAGGDILYGSVASDDAGLIWTDITAKIDASNSTSIIWDDVPLATGTHDLIFRITDIADNNTTVSLDYTLDQTAPNIVFSNIAFSDDTGTESDDFITNTATQTISATLDLALDTAGGDILYGSVASDDAGLIWTDITAKIDTSNSTSIIWDDVPLATGTHGLIFRITDIADNNTTFDQEYTLDQTAPNIVISDIAFSDDTGTESDDFITNTATQTISATLDLALDTAGGDILYGSVASDDAGLIWTDITAKIDSDDSTSIIWDDVPLATGTHDLIFRITDIADNNTTFDQEYTLDQTAPNIVISDIAFSDDTGTESDDFITNTATQTISATLDLALDTAGGDILYGSVASDDAGLIWTDITAKIDTSNSTSIIWDDVPLATGTHDLIFRITDIADNNTTFDQEYTLDQTAPNIVISDIAFSDDTGTESDDFITNTAAQTISATLDLALDTAGGDILYGSVASNDAGLIWTDITAKIDTSNSTSIIWDDVPLATGTHDLIFRITDIADNNTTFDQEYTLDQTAPNIVISAIAFSDDTGTESDDFITNTATQTISATLDLALDTAGGDILYGSVASDDAGLIWTDITAKIDTSNSISIVWDDVPLATGTHDLIFRITDIADNNTTFDQEYTLDQTAPDIDFSAVSFSNDTGTKSDDFITNSAKQTISATLSAALDTAGGDILYGSVSSDNNSAPIWLDITDSISEIDGTTTITWGEVDLVLGTHKLILRITDIADNNTTFEKEYTLDQTVPNIVISDIAFSDDTGTKPDDFITNSAKQTISANLSAALATGDILYGSVGSDDAGLIWTDITAKIDASNSTSIIWDDVPLATGTHDLIFRITDIADNNTTVSLDYTLDQTAPNIVFSNIAFSDDTGTESDDFITNTATQTISATLDLALDTAGGDILYGSVASDDAGLIWTDITAKIDTSNSTSIIWDDVPLATGTHGLIFRITDIADNNTTFDQEYTLDQTAPNIVISDIAFSDDTGTESDDFITNTATQTISANLDLALDTAGGDILYGSVASDDAGLIWTDITAKIDTSNSTSIIWDDVPLATGTHDLIFRITDIADNNTTFDQEYTLDQTAPNIVISDIAFSDDTGTESDDFITNTAAQTISATLDLALDTAGGDILYGSVASNDAGLIWTDITAKIDTSNSTSIIWDDVPLATGTHDLIFRITDIADNNTTFDQEYTLDQTAPNIVISAIAFSDDTGTESDDFITNTATQTISATLDLALDTAGGDILYGSVASDDAGLIWTDITAKIDTSNSTSIIWDDVPLATGTHDLIFRITDIADNNTTFDQEYTLDQTAPNIVISAIAFSDDTGTESDDFITNIATQTISATLDLALDTAGGDILYGSVASDDAGLIWTDITAKIDSDDSTSIIWDDVPLATGTHDLIFRITDIADNNTTFDQEYTLDQTAPNIVISAIAFSDDTGTESDDFITNTATQTISAALDLALDTAGGDILYGSVASDDAGLIWTDITAKINTSNDGSINITWDGVELSTGTHDLIFRITDIADNNTTVSLDYTLDQTAPNIVISDIAFSDDTGTKPDDFITNSDKQTISANLSAALATGDILYGSVGSDESGALDWEDITESVSSVDGTTTINWDEVELKEGEHNLIFRITDIADNNTTFDQEYTLDQTVPNIVISDIAFSDDTGTKSNDFITNIESQTISATLSAALDTDGGDTLHGSLDSGSSWTDITGKISDSTKITWNGVTLETGSHKLIFRITDIADNNTTVSLDYTLDQTPPDINTNGTASEVSEAFAAALDASSSSDDGSGIASYSWAQVASDGSTWSGDTLIIASTNSATTSASTPGIADDDGANLSFYFAVTIADIAGNDSTSSALTLTVTNAYKTPDITASAGTAPDFNQLSLSWAATSGLTYNLHRSTASSCDLSDTENCAHHLEYAALDLSSGDQITQIDSDLGLFSSYYYWLEAQLNGEVVSLSSAPLEANTTGPVLNDTGVIKGADYPNGFDSLGDGVCNGGYIDSNDDDDDGDTNEFIAFANEDCELGRDATNNDDRDGHAGFSFTKLDTDGTPLAADAISWACVVDNTTGLIWEVKTDDGSWQDKDEGFTWHDPYNATFSGTASDQDTDDFIAYANSSLAVNNAQGLCGRTDWRLPTVHEIQGLTDYSAVVANGSGGYTTPAIDTTYFPHASTVPDQWYWTAQLNVNTAVNANTSTNNYYAWAYGSALGNTSSGTDSSTVGATSNTNLVRLVSSSTAVESHFSDYSNDRYNDNGDGTISDAKTGLMWMKCTYGQAYNSNNNSCNSNGAISGDWLAAFTNAAASNSANSGNGSFAFTDWRLPNVKELGSIVDFGNHSPAINQSIFPNTVSAAYWSSTPSQADNSQTIIIGFQAGDYGAAARNTTATTYLRLVRDDIKTPRILTLNINGDNIVNVSDSSNLGSIPVSGSTGDVESGQQLSLVINGITYSADIADDGSFTTTIDLSTLADGTYGVTADVSDINNKAANQFTSTLRKDIVLPSITEVIVAGDDIINIAEASAATISGTTDGVEDGQIVSVVISDSSDPAVEITATASVTSNAFNITNLNLSSLADSTSISLSANVADSAGNSAATFTNTLIKDTAAPTIAITSVATDNKINASEASTAAIIGTASEDDQSVALAITDGSTTVEATPTVADGLYSATVDLSSLAESTSISLSATILDTAGNDATATQESITKDTIAPSIASIFVADNNFVNSKELDNAVAVSGATSGVEDYQAITITINGEDISTDVIASTFTTDADLSDLNDGTYSLSANVADAAGNPAEKFTGSYVIETVPPTQAVKPDSISLSHDTSSSTSYFLTNQAAQTISAELNASLGSDEALYASVDSGSTWLIIYSEENLTDSTGSPTTSFSWDTTLQEGTYSIYFRVTDTADNNSTDTTQAYTLDLSAPQISSAATASIPENTSDTIYTALARDTETMSLGLSLSYALSGTDATQLSIDSESGEISFKSSPDHENPTDASTGAEGSVDAADTNNTYQITLEATDPAGNTATQELTITVTDLNDVAPVIDPEQSLGIIETSATGGTVGTVAAIDPDTANTFTWSITDADNGGSTTIDNPSTYFAINSSTGQITVTQALTENAAGADSYDVKLNLQVSDGVNAPYQGPVTITVQAAILPDDFGVAGIGAYLVKLTWSELEGASDLYYIYRSSDNACDLANYNSCADGLLSSSVTPPFTDIVPESGIAYYYWLHAERPNSTLTQTSATPISATPEPRLNDTGIYWNAANNGGNNSDCVSNTNIDAPQDCDYGLDANTTVADDADGHAGFSFTKLGSDGYPLSANASSWSCVQDNVTGLIWEVKTDGGNGDDIGGDLHDKDDTYNWYNTNSETNGGSDGYADDDGAICYGYGSANSTTFCNTEAFVARVNSAGLCGAHDWRLPHINEIRSISNYAFSNAASGARLPGIDTSYFPNTQMHVNNKVVSYWSASPSVSASEEAWTHNYYYDTMSDKEYTEALYIRLVRGGQ